MMGEHFRGSGLLLKCLCQITSALPQFVEQPRILDGDDGLGREIRYECDLLVGEGPDLLAGQSERADQFVLFQHGDRQKRPYSTKFDSGNRCWIALFNIRLLGRRSATCTTFLVATARPAGVFGAG